MSWVRGSTTVAAVIGDPVGHSLSPAIHNAAFAEAGLDWVYVALPVAAGNGAAAVDAMRVNGLGGMSVTMPHKDAVAAAADEVSDTVAALGAANCLVPVGDGRIRAENTDGAGFLAALAEEAGIDIAGRSVALLGAGGAARAVALACAEGGASGVLVINRSPDRAAACAALAAGVGKVVDVAEVSTVDIVVNATPLGMGDDGAMPCDPGLLHHDQVVVDLIYNPLETPWLAAVRAAGIEGHDGISMLVHQAAVAFTLWTGSVAPIEAMRAAVARNFA